MSVTRSHAVVDHGERRQAPRREHELADEAAAGLLRLVGVVVDHDRLEQHRAVRAQELAAAAEELVEVLPAHRLDHLDRHELVVAPAQVAVVLGRAPPRDRTRPAVAHPLHGRWRAARPRSWWWSPGSRSGPRRAARTSPSPCRSRARGRPGRGRACGRRGRAFAPAPRRGPRRPGRRRRTSRSWSRRGTARTGRCRGRSGRPRACAPPSAS